MANAGRGRFEYGGITTGGIAGGSSISDAGKDQFQIGAYIGVFRPCSSRLMEIEGESIRGMMSTLRARCVIINDEW